MNETVIALLKGREKGERKSCCQATKAYIMPYMMF